MTDPNNPEEDPFNSDGSPKIHPTATVQDLKTSLQILVARTLQTHQLIGQPANANNYGTILQEMMKNQIVIMGACAALITNVINVKESMGES